MLFHIIRPKGSRKWRRRQMPTSYELPRDDGLGWSVAGGSSAWNIGACFKMEKEHNYRKSPFSIGKLSTSIGNFPYLCYSIAEYIPNEPFR